MFMRPIQLGLSGRFQMYCIIKDYILSLVSDVILVDSIDLIHDQDRYNNFSLSGKCLLRKTFTLKLFSRRN